MSQSVLILLLCLPCLPSVSATLLAQEVLADGTTRAVSRTPLLRSENQEASARVTVSVDAFGRPHVLEHLALVDAVSDMLENATIQPNSEQSKLSKLVRSRLGSKEVSVPVTASIDTEIKPHVEQLLTGSAHSEGSVMESKTYKEATIANATDARAVEDAPVPHENLEGGDANDFIAIDKHVNDQDQHGEQLLTGSADSKESVMDSKPDAENSIANPAHATAVEDAPVPQEISEGSDAEDFLAMDKHVDDQDQPVEQLLTGSADSEGSEMESKPDTETGLANANDAGAVEDAPVPQEISEGDDEKDLISLDKDVDDEAHHAEQLMTGSTDFEGSAMESKHDAETGLANTADARAVEDVPVPQDDSEGDDETDFLAIDKHFDDEDEDHDHEDHDEDHDFHESIMQMWEDDSDEDHEEEHDEDHGEDHDDMSAYHDDEDQDEDHDEEPDYYEEDYEDDDLEDDHMKFKKMKSKKHRKS